MKAFVTGGTGFIGQRLVRKLVERGYEVWALARSPQGLALVESLGAVPVEGDLNTPGKLRGPMANSDVVFHTAGWYKLGSLDKQTAEQVNVEGTRTIFGVAHELDVPRVIYTSSVAVYGDTHGEVVDETTPIPNGPFLTEYDHSKWRAHVEVVQPAIEMGAPVIIVMPGVVYGPGDHSLVGSLMRGYFLGLFPFPLFPAPELGLSYTYVDDVAEGHILAAEKGRLGQTYILTGPTLRGREAGRTWAEILGRPEPKIFLPPQLLKPLGPLFDLAGRVLPLPTLYSKDAVSVLGATYFARSQKAQDELGWQPRSMLEGMRATFDWIAQSERREVGAAVFRKQAAGLAAGTAVGLLLMWLLRKRRKS